MQRPPIDFRAASDTTPVLRVVGLCFGWPQQPALFDHLSFELPPGVSLITGDELTGKTTLLRLLQGELSPRSGHIQFLGPAQRTWRSQPEDPSKDATSTRQWWAECERSDPNFQTQLAHNWAEGFDLIPHLDKPLYMLSAGSRRKAAICTAMASQATLTLIDLPFAALDLPSIQFFKQGLCDASRDRQRAWVLADYDEPAGVPLASVIHLGG